jgi:hypothetical protein
VAEKSQLDSPIGQLIQGYPFPDLSKLQEDVSAFEEKIINTKNQKEALAALVKQWKDLDKTKAKGATDDEKKQVIDAQQKVVDSIIKIQNDEGDNLKFNYDLLYSILNAYKSVGAFAAITAMLKPLVDGNFKDNIYIKQQLGLAYNKIGKREEAETVLKNNH